MSLAPIVLFAYNRPQHVKQTLESLSNNLLSKESDLFVYIDGPKAGASDEQINKINEVKRVAREKQWCKIVSIIEAESNKGLAKSIIEGVTEVVSKYGTIIVIEDDVLLSSSFLEFMNNSLKMYKYNPKVLSIGSWNYFCTPTLLNDNFFYRFPDSIAWGTFDRAWKLFEHDEKVALRKIIKNKKLHQFNGDLPFPYFSDMLRSQIDGKINSWAIRWTATAIINDMLSFFPHETLSKHMGFGNAATHETGDADYNAHLTLAETSIKIKAIPVVENAIAIMEWRRFILLNFIKPNNSLGHKLKKHLKKTIPTFIIHSIRRK